MKIPEVVFVVSKTVHESLETRDFDPANLRMVGHFKVEGHLGDEPGPLGQWERVATVLKEIHGRSMDIGEW